MKRLAALLAVLAASCFAQIGQQFKTGQQAVTATAAALSNLNTQYVCLKVLAGGTQTVYFGNSSSVTTSTGYPLAAGDTACIEVNNLNQVWVVASNTGSTLAWFTTWEGPTQ